MELFSIADLTTSDRRWLMADQLGSVIAATNAAGALIGAPNTYDEYGTPAASNTGRFQYTGQIWLAEVGLYHYKARAYAPTLGRFLQTDPILHAGGMNLYAYVGNDPVNWVDPLGLQAWEGNPDDDIIVGPPVSPHWPESRVLWEVWKLFPPHIDGPAGSGEPDEIVITARRVAREIELEIAVNVCPFLRPPDFFMFEGSVPIPQFPALGPGLFGIIDRHGQRYLGPQFGVGAPTGGGFHLWAGWMNATTLPPADRLRDFLSGLAIQFSAVGPRVGIMPPSGVQFMGNQNGTALLVGGGTQGLSLQGSYSFDFESRISGLAWASLWPC